MQKEKAMSTVRCTRRVLSFLRLSAALGAIFLAGCASTRPAYGAEPAPRVQPTQPEWKAYFGNLHAHTAVSDGVERPAVAYAYARDEGRLQFLCLSEHNHILTAAGLAEVLQAAQAATGPDFVGLVGQEFSLLDPGNHVNVYDVTVPVPKSMDNNYRGLYREWLPQYQAQHADAIVFCQFNHPESAAKDYGIAPAGGFANYEGNWDQFRTEADPWVKLIAIINGPSTTANRCLWPACCSVLRARTARFPFSQFTLAEVSRRNSDAMPRPA
jgi:hypothetical protein